MEVLLGSLGDLLSGRGTDADAAIHAAASVFDQWWSVRNGEGIPGGYPWNHGHQRPRGGQRQPPSAGPPPDVNAELRRAARRVLGFSDAERLTVATVKDRRRMLAKKHHPDYGGSAAMMARINDAADVLLASL
jgi:hypothetical protein